MSSRFSRTPTCGRRTDGRTDTRRQLKPALASVARLKTEVVGADVAGSAGGDISQFRCIRAVLLGSHAVHDQKDGVGDAVHHGNYRRRISQRRRQYIPRNGTYTASLIFQFRFTDIFRPL